MRKAFTIVELVIVLVMIGMLALILAVPVISLCGGFGRGYSDGERTGIVTKLSHKGFIWKSYEGQMNVGAFSVDAGGVMNSKPWEFSVTDPEVVAEINKAAESGQRTTLVYTQYMINPAQISTPYVIVAVKHYPNPRLMN